MQIYKKYLSIIIPIYNEEGNILKLYNKIISSLEASRLSNYEIIFINDGSTDDSATLLYQISKKDFNAKIINLVTNQGQTAAISAGIEYSQGEIIIPMDGDLQNDPKDIPNLIDKLNEGFDVVSGWRKHRKDKTISRILPSKIANWIVSKISGVYLHDYGCSLKAYRSHIIKNIKLYGEMHRFIPVFSYWQGGKIEEIVVAHHPRKHGKTSYGISRTYKVIIDLILIKFFEKYSTKPGHLFGGFGLINFFISFLIFFLMLFLRYSENITFIETPLPQLTVLFFLIGVQSIFIGLIAELVMRTYYESQDKKIYKIKDLYNFKDSY